MRLIDADAVIDRYYAEWEYHCIKLDEDERAWLRQCIDQTPTIEAELVRHGRWILEAHKEKANYRWNVTAECSECCDEKNEIYAGFFPGVPDYLAKDVILDSAKSVKLSNYCPNCGAKMDGEQNGA